MRASSEPSPGPRVISASRRTDIPAFYAEWFKQALDRGEVQVKNPFGGGWQQVSLRPEAVSAIVFWTKDFGPLMGAVEELCRRGYLFYVHFTITGLPRCLEPRVPCAEAAIRQFRELARRLGPEKMQWRFDPIVISGELTAAETRERFRRLSAELEGMTRRCYTSFVHLYKKVERNLAAAGIERPDPPRMLKEELLGRMAGIAAERGMKLFVCCDDLLVGGEVRKAKCVDPEILEKIGAKVARPVRWAPSRPGCGCMQSTDIGAYDTCPHGCVYCYANSDFVRACRNYVRHRPEEAAILGGA